MNLKAFPLDRLDEVKKNPDSFRLLEQIPLTKEDVQFPLQISQAIGDEQVAVILDTETTGLFYEEDEILELGMVKVMYSPSKKIITSIVDVVSLYEEPTIEIPEFITTLTGISNETVKGQHINDDTVSDFLDCNPLIIAHNAKFDRAFFEKRFPDLKHFAWACSSVGINWEELGFQSAKLEWLLLNLGWFYNGHRASIDCLAVVWLFNILNESFVDLLDNSNLKTITVRALDAPFEAKDVLKDRGYRWFAGNSNMKKHWWIDIDESQLEEEKEFLNSTYYCGSKKARYEEKDATKRFKPI